MQAARKIPIADRCIMRTETMLRAHNAKKEEDKMLTIHRKEAGQSNVKANDCFQVICCNVYG